MQQQGLGQGHSDVQPGNQTQFFYKWRKAIVQQSCQSGHSSSEGLLQQAFDCKCIVFETCRSYPMCVGHKNAMVVHLPNGNKIKFCEYVDGLYYFGTRNTIKDQVKNTHLSQTHILVFIHSKTE